MEASQQDPQDQPVQTPQPDPPAPTEAEQPVEAPTAEVGPSGQPAEGTVAPAQYPSGTDQVAAQEQREGETAQARQEHNDRTGGGEVREGELQAQRDEHNRRVAAQEPQTQAPVDEA